MTTEEKYCPNPDECDGNCPTLKDKVHIIDNYYRDGLKETESKLNNLMRFLINFFGDDENIQPIKNEIQSLIDIQRKFNKLK